MTSLHPTVAAIGDLHLEGNVIPHVWYQATALQLANGKINLVAITLLADLVYWYRPTIRRDEATGRVIEVSQKFRADKLQKDYRKWGEQFGLSKGQTEDAVHFLRNAGLLTTETRTIEVMGRLIGNVVFIEPVAEAIKAITSLVALQSPTNAPPSPDETVKGSGSTPPPSPDGTVKGAGSIGEASSDETGKSPPIERCNTYTTTKTTADISTYTTTTAAPPKTTSVQEASIVVSSASRKSQEASPSPPEHSVAPQEHVSAPSEIVEVTAKLKLKIGQNALAVTALMKCGVTPVAAAKRLVEKHGEHLCLDWIEALPYCKYDDAARYLVAALEKGYKLPTAMIAARKDKTRRAQQRETEKCRAQQIRQATISAREERDAQQRQWAALTPARMEQIERQARAEIAARPMGERLLQGPLGKENVRTRCLQLMVQADATTTTLRKAA